VGIGVLVVQVLGPAIGFTGQEALLEAGQHGQAVDAGGKQGHDDNI